MWGCVCALLHYFKPFFFVATPPFFSLFIDLLSFTVNNLFENNKTFLLSKLVWLLKSHFEMCHWHFWKSAWFLSRTLQKKTSAWQRSQKCKPLDFSIQNLHFSSRSTRNSRAEKRSKEERSASSSPTAAAVKTSAGLCHSSSFPSAGPVQTPPFHRPSPEFDLLISPVGDTSCPSRSVYVLMIFFQGWPVPPQPRSHSGHTGTSRYRF